MIYSKDITVGEALCFLEKNCGQTIFLVDKNSKLVGSCSDGDIRRFFISGGTIECSALNAANNFPIYRTVHGELRNITDDRAVKSIPVLNSDFQIERLIDLTKEKLPMAFPEIASEWRFTTTAGLV